MPKGKQFAIKEVNKLTISDYSTGKLIAYVPYATETSLSTDSEHLAIFGGEGNLKILSWDYEKSMKISMVLPLIDLNILAHLAGSDSLENEVATHKDETLLSNGGNEPNIELSHIPVSGSLKLYSMTSYYNIDKEQELGDIINEDEYEIDGKIISLNEITAPTNRRFLAMYDYITLNDSKTIQMFANRFNNYVRITGEGAWRNVVDHKDEVVKFEFCKCKIIPSFNITQSSTDNTSLTIEADLYYKPIGMQKVFANIISTGVRVEEKFHEYLLTSDNEYFETSDGLLFMVKLQ